MESLTPWGDAKLDRLALPDAAPPQVRHAAPQKAPDRCSSCHRAGVPITRQVIAWLCADCHEGIDAYIRTHPY